MSSSERAQKEIFISEPYFRLLGEKSVKRNLKILLIKQAPSAFFSVLTQTVRHILNGTFCFENKKLCEKFENSLYLIALPSTKKADKQKILETESSEFILELFQALKNALK